MKPQQHQRHRRALSYLNGETCGQLNFWYLIGRNPNVRSHRGRGRERRSSGTCFAGPDLHRLVIIAAGSSWRTGRDPGA
ncbi:hypothetical protein CFIMG_008100RA00001 [Ceratocystis fimbriata CBS 114723]|uniref:Uncharacterized protein n=1 Tax=Ceratocystis fimbriata CBS 114723 TaxID=1035309 RepID=A0A2C5X1Z7_9PEZI|nr:hypothetical protein CFIMG_008100RA00001 [Ceratocystis fimbriata CBS 114723]